MVMVDMGSVSRQGVSPGSQVRQVRVRLYLRSGAVKV